jgi:hypothetical protein
LLDTGRNHIVFVLEWLRRCNVTRKSTTTRYVYVDGYELKIGCHTASVVDSPASKRASDAVELHRAAVGNRNRTAVLPVDSVTDVIEPVEE